MDEVCFQTGVTHYVCVFSCWAESWMVIMALSTTASSRFTERVVAQTGLHLDDCIDRIVILFELM